MLYCHVEDDNTQNVEIPHYEKSAEEAETNTSNSTLATGESPRGAHHYPLGDH